MEAIALGASYIQVRVTSSRNSNPSKIFMLGLEYFDIDPCIIDALQPLIL